MRADRVVRHQLLGHLLRQAGLEPAGNIYGGQFTSFRSRVRCKLGALARQSAFSVSACE